jgi:hypothetical protein
MLGTATERDEGDRGHEQESRHHPGPLYPFVGPLAVRAGAEAKAGSHRTEEPHPTRELAARRSAHELACREARCVRGREEVRILVRPAPHVRER